MECPLRGVCQCLGHEEELPDTNNEGFIPILEGYLCLDWDIIVPYEKIPDNLKLEVEKTLIERR